MNKSTQYNQQSEPKQCKSEFEEICIYQNLESGRHTHASFFLFLIFLRKSSKPRHKNLVLITWTVQAELSGIKLFEF